MFSHVCNYGFDAWWGPLRWKNVCEFCLAKNVSRKAGDPSGQYGSTFELVPAAKVSGVGGFDGKLLDSPNGFGGSWWLKPSKIMKNWTLA